MQHGALVSQLLEANCAEQRWLLQMYGWRQAGWGYARIATELNRLNVPTKTGLGNLITYRGPPTIELRPMAKRQRLHPPSKSLIAKLDRSATDVLRPLTA
jgi:hypothetical protein